MAEPLLLLAHWIGRRAELRPRHTHRATLVRIVDAEIAPDLDGTPRSWFWARYA